MDPNNSLLLLSSIHKAFDAGLISFNDDGNILISSSIDDDWELHNLGLSGKERIIMPGSRKEYMRWHREKVFK
jgi:predicted restriction endonuclease